MGNFNKKRKMNNQANDIKILLPSDTSECINNHSIDNYYLKLNKAIYFDDKNLIFSETDEKGNKINDLNYHFNRNDVENIASRRKEMIRESGLITKTIILKPIWRLAVGLGQHSVYETSINLHHIFGIPYIPGSAVKGVTRSWVINNFFNGSEGDKKNGALSDGGFCKIFGSPEESLVGYNQGAICFFDALPESQTSIEKDITNPHFNDYYRGGKPPADYLDPKPVYFLTVKNTSFRFILGIAPKNNQVVSVANNEGNILDLTLNMVKIALKDHGIGAKTAVGYGVMEE
jgi:CRISPR-associated protein Cmr6